MTDPFSRIESSPQSNVLINHQPLTSTSAVQKRPKLRAAAGGLLALVMLASGCSLSVGAPEDEPAWSPSAVVSASAAEPNTTAESPAPSPTPEPFRASPRDTRPRSVPRPLARQLQYGSNGADVRELQSRLRQIKHFASVDLSDNFGERTRRGVVDFQRSQGLPATGVVDQETWDRLLPLTADPSAEELANRDVGYWFVGYETPGFVAELQHRLHQLGLYSGPTDGQWTSAAADAVRTFRAQSGLTDSIVVDERAWQALKGRTRNPAYSELWNAPPPGLPHTQQLDPRCTAAGKIMCVSMDQRLMTYVKDGQPVLTLDARFGSPSHPTVKGEFKIWHKDWTVVSNIFGERTPMPYAMFFDGDRAFHYSQDFKEIGWDGFSHGCAQTYDYQALKWLYDELPVGTRVIVY